MGGYGNPVTYSPSISLYGDLQSLDFDGNVLKTISKETIIDLKF